MKDESLTEFLAAVAAPQPAPAGGSVAALAVAAAAALTQSVARLSRGDWEEAGGAVAQAAAVERRALPLIEEAAGAYGEAAEALAGREAIRPEERDQRIGDTVARAAEVPLQIGEAGADLAELAALVAENANHKVRADAIASAHLAEAAARIAATLVGVNLTITGEDPRLVHAADLVARAERASHRAAAAIGDS